MDGQQMHGGLEPSYQNDYNSADDFSNFLSNGTDNDNLNWPYDASANVASNAQSAQYLPSWQSSTGLDGYGSHAFNKNPSHHQQNAYAGYGDPHQFARTHYDPSLVSGPINGVSSFHSPYAQQPMQHGTIAPQALEQQRAHGARPDQTLGNQTYAQSNVADATGYNRSTPQAPLVDQTAIYSAIPPGDPSGSFVVIDPEKLSKATNSNPFRPFINIGNEEYNYPINKAALPPLVRRKSRNELRIIAENDPKLQAKLKKSHKKQHSTSKLAFSSHTPSNKASLDQSGSEEESSEYSSSDESEDENPLPPQKPSDPREAIKYDTIKALWEGSRYDVGKERILHGMVEFNQIVQAIRDRLRSDTKALADATKQDKTGELPLLKSRVNSQLGMMEISLRAAIQHGHRAILDQLGKSLPLVSSLSQLLIERIKSSEMDGPLTRVILEFLTYCTSLAEKPMIETKLHKTLTWLAKNGNADIQDLAKLIKTNAAEATKRQTPNEQVARAVGDNGPTVKSPPSNRPTPEPVAGMKRAAPGNTQSDQAPKRIITSSGVVGTGPNGTGKASPTVKRILPLGTSVKSAAMGKPISGAVKAKPVATKLPSTAATGPTIKKAVTAKPTSVVAAAIKSIEKKVTPAAPARPAFSFAETMANLNKPKEKEPTPKVEEKQIQETPEEKAKRLRKEQRRKLRVTFKPDSQLVQVRVFHHDAEEELGHDANMIRDVADVGGEGRMFKQHKEMMDIDEEDDATGEETLREYLPLSLTDFSTVDSEERKRNYTPYGGGELQPDSPERTAREQHDLSTLMVFYTHPSDIPACPREPTNPYDGEGNTTKMFGAPDAQGLVATRAAKLGAVVQAQPQSQQPSTAPDLSAILAMINRQSQTPPQPVQQPPAAPSETSGQMSEIQRILANLPQVQQPQQPQQSVQPPPPSMPPNLAGIFASLQPQTQETNQTQPPIMDANSANLAALFTQLNQGQNGTPGPNSMANFGQFGFPSAGLNIPNLGQPQPPLLQQQQQQQQQQHQFENEERRRWRENGENESNQARRAKGAKKAGGPVDKRFTVPCKYWGYGKCQKGANCTYLHD